MTCPVAERDCPKLCVACGGFAERFCDYSQVTIEIPAGFCGPTMSESMPRSEAAKKRWKEDDVRLVKPDDEGYLSDYVNPPSPPEKSILDGVDLHDL